MSIAPTSARSTVGWRDVRRLVRERIVSREWKPGDAIPNEVDLAAELGCARATVNRALRDLADEGLIDRRRRSGSRVAEAPTRRATFRIPIIAAEIAEKGMVAGYALLRREEAHPPPDVRARMAPPEEAPADLLHLVSVHTADGRPFMLEDRWIDPRAFPLAATADFAATSANEWLVTHAPFDHGEIAFSAAAASESEAGTLAIAPGEPVFTVERVTFSAPDAVRALTHVRQVFAPGYAMRSRLP